MTTYTAWYMTIAALVHGQVILINGSDLSRFFFFYYYYLFIFTNGKYVFYFYFWQVEGVKHSGPTELVLYFTGATNILYTFGGHAVTV